MTIINTIITLNTNHPVEPVVSDVEAKLALISAGVGGVKYEVIFFELNDIPNVELVSFLLSVSSPIVEL